MKLIIGLGNPGKNHAITRHNAGFLCIDYLQKAWHFGTFQLNQKMSGEISESNVGKEKVLLVKPDTFMNASGTTVSQLVHFYKITPEDIMVIHDDLDIASGTYKVTSSSRAAGHNGVSDVIEKLGTQDFPRIRLGIGRPVAVSGACMPSHDFVLQNFSKEELVTLSALFPAVKDELHKWLRVA
ncbi:MAG: aminoacyl-tRNA hydrolase [Candidatus Moranbacteria bacterium]|nr:aminoacyl-tRNA hydrolase [Candidatus Moranbacteria bacterium]